MTPWFPEHDGWPLIPDRNERRGVLLLVLASVIVLTGVVWIRYAGSPGDLSSISPESTYPNLNRDPATRIEEIPGIGPVRSKAIARHRRRHGPYERYQDLKNVHGIGPETIEKIKPYSKLREKETGN